MLLHSSIHNIIDLKLKLMFVQTQNLLATLNQTVTNGLRILEGDREKVNRVAENLRDALHQATTADNERSVLPRDLETATKFVEVVAK